MKHLNTKTKFGSSILPFALCIFLLLLCACGDGSGTSDEASSGTSDEASSGTSDEASSDTGSIAFSLVWEEAASKSGVRQVQTAHLSSGDVCDDYGIETISAEVYNSSDTEVASGSWPCSDYKGTISDVPTGSGMWVKAQGSVPDGGVVCDGGTEERNITVTAGQITNAGTVIMNYIASPEVALTNPSNGDTGVALNAAITATFSEDMVSASVNSSSFTLETGTTTIDGSVIYNSSTRTATFIPDSKLSSPTTYTVTITTGVEDLAGNQMTDNYTWSFTTADTIPPTAGSPSPPDGATDVAIYSVVTATFSEPMDPASVNSSSFTLMAGTTTVSGSVTYNSTTLSATFIPNSNLSFSTTYTVTITTEVKNIVGNQMAGNYTWSFTTSQDTTPPTAGSPSPPNGATDVAVNSVVTATFSEAVDPASVNSSSFTLRAGTTIVSGSVIYSSSTRTATFIPDSELSSPTTYTVTITTGVEDLAGNQMTDNYTWSFTTADTTPPTAGSPSPPDGATDVAVNSVVSATFSEHVDSASVNTSSFTLMAGTTTVSGSVTYNSTTLSATFTPDSNLSLSTTYIVTITMDIKDLAGNQMRNNYTWNFKTSPHPVVATIKVGNHPQSVAVNPNGSYVYVTNTLDDTVSVIQTSDNTVLATIKVGDSPYGVAVTPYGSYVYVTNFIDDTISVIQTSDNTVLATIYVGDGPHGVAVNPNGSYVYVAKFLDDTVSVIQTSDNTVLATIKVGNRPDGVAVTPDGNYVYVTNVYDDTVSVIQTSDNTVLATIKVGDGPHGVAVNPNGSYVYVANTFDYTVSVIQTSNNTVLATISYVGYPIDIAVTPTGSYVYVTNNYDDTVSVIQTSDNTVLATIKVGDFPYGVAVTPNGSYIYVTNNYDDTVSVIAF